MSHGFGGECTRCGHPASYHGQTFCVVKVGAGPPEQRRVCDCEGWAASPTQSEPRP